MAEIIYTQGYIKIAKKFIQKHPELLSQYTKTLKLLELNPYHPSLRLHKLHGRLENLYYVSINISYRITLEFIIEANKIIPVYVGHHDSAY